MVGRGEITLQLRSTNQRKLLAVETPEERGLGLECYSTRCRVQQPMLPQLSLFQQCSIQSQDVMQTWLHWRCQDALLVQKHFVALFHPKPNECLRFDLESCNLMCTYTVVTHPCHISPLAQARPMMLCIYTSLGEGPIRTSALEVGPVFLFTDHSHSHNIV